MTKKNIIIFILLAALAGCGKKLPTPSEKAGEQTGVPRRVLLELFTTTWCTNCPLADSAAWALAVESGTDITLIEYHFTVPGSIDPFIFNQADLRAAFYGIEAPPVMVCEGLSLLGGAVEYERTYQDYKTAFNNRLLLKSPIAISLTGQAQNGVINYHLEITSQQSITQTDLKLLLVVMEDSIFYNAPNGVDLHRFVARQIIPDYQGTAIALNYGTTFTKDGAITPDPGWNLNRLHLAAFVQSYATKEVLQSASLSLAAAAYNFTVIAPDTLADVKKDSLALFPLVIRNTGSAGDTLVLEIPDSSSSATIARSLWNTSSGTITGFPAQTGFLAPGDSLTNYVVCLSDSTIGNKKATLVVYPKHNPAQKQYLNFHLNVALSIVYDFTLTAPETLKTVQINSQAEFRFTLKNTGTVGDFLILDIPDSLLHPNVTLKSLCNLTGLCYPIPYTTKTIAAGDSLVTLVVHLGSDVDGPIYGTLIATSKSDSSLQRRIQFYVDVILK